MGVIPTLNEKIVLMEKENMNIPILKEKIMSIEEQLTMYGEKYISSLKDIVEVMNINVFEEEVIHNSSTKNAIPDVEKYEEVIKREMISMKKKINDYSERLAVEQEKLDNLPSIMQWKQVQTGLLALKEKYDNAVQKIKRLEEEKGFLLP